MLWYAMLSYSMVWYGKYGMLWDFYAMLWDFYAMVYVVKDKHSAIVQLFYSFVFVIDTNVIKQKKWTNETSDLWFYFRSTVYVLISHLSFM